MKSVRGEPRAGYFIIDQFGLVWQISAQAARLLQTERPAFPVHAFGERPSLGLGEALLEHIRDAFQSDGQTTEIMELQEDPLEAIRLDSRVWLNPVDRKRYLVTVVDGVEPGWPEETKGEAERRVDTFLSGVARTSPDRAAEALVRAALQRSGAM